MLSCCLVDGRPEILTGGRIRIKGRNFGVSSSPAQVYLGKTKAPSATWVSDQVLLCSAAAGVGSGLEIRVQIAMQDAIMANPRAPVKFDYDAPYISRLQPWRLPLQGPGAKGLVTISGTNFGHAGMGENDLVVTVQGERGTAVVEPLQHTDSAIVIMLDEGGGGVMTPQTQGTTRGVQVTVVVRLAGQVGVSRLALVPASGTTELVIAGNSELVSDGEASHAKIRSLIAAISSQWVDSSSGNAAAASPEAVSSEFAQAKNEDVLIVSKTPQARRAGAVVLTVRFLSALSAPESGRAMLQSFAQSLRQCCSLHTLVDTDVLACPDTLSSAAAAGACANVAALSVLEVSFEDGALDPAGSPAVPQPAVEENVAASDSADPRVGSGSVPSWVLPTLSVGGAGLCLIGGLAFLIWSELKRRREDTHADEDDEDEDDEFDGLEEKVIEGVNDGNEGEKGPDAVNEADGCGESPALGPETGEAESSAVKVHVNHVKSHKTLFALTIKAPGKDAADLEGSRRVTQADRITGGEDEDECGGVMGYQQRVPGKATRTSTYSGGGYEAGAHDCAATGRLVIGARDEKVAKDVIDAGWEKGTTDEADSSGRTDPVSPAHDITSREDIGALDQDLVAGASLSDTGGARRPITDGPSKGPYLATRRAPASSASGDSSGGGDSSRSAGIGAGRSPSPAPSLSPGSHGPDHGHELVMYPESTHDVMALPLVIPPPRAPPYLSEDSSAVDVRSLILDSNIDSNDSYTEVCPLKRGDETGAYDDSACKSETSICTNLGDFDNQSSAELVVVESESDETLVPVQNSQPMALWSPTFLEPNPTFCSLEMDAMYEGLLR